MDDGVRIQDEDIFATARLDRYIVPLREPQIHPIFDQSNLRKFFADELDGSISRSIVRNDDLKIRRMGAGIDGSQAVRDDFEVVPTQDNDG